MAHGGSEIRGSVYRAVLRSQESAFLSAESGSATHFAPQRIGLRATRPRLWPGRASVKGDPCQGRRRRDVRRYLRRVRSTPSALKVNDAINVSFIGIIVMG
ncbi:hypothetical protein GWI33_001701 [Rhynchophorus ferrugineus]|uniref:Uncharacterized protein n=1 Tax=Rhynchophorus ferrugineus TaxID=354439 RepID=A0A834MLS2_RHYFE|nr:hypothetical protein GWI33_001701 [Rhynchophorus ferrugineus]